MWFKRELCSPRLLTGNSNTRDPSQRLSILFLFLFLSLSLCLCLSIPPLMPVQNAGCLLARSRCLLGSTVELQNACTYDCATAQLRVPDSLPCAYSIRAICIRSRTGTVDNGLVVVRITGAYR